MSKIDYTALIEYRTIDRFPGYRFGSDGTVQSRFTFTGSGWTIGSTWRPIKLVLSRQRWGHLSFFSGRKRYSAHILISEAFFGRCPVGMECRHLDGNRLNNRIENLAYGTHVENMRDSVNHGTHAHGERAGSAKLKASDIREIRFRRDNGESTGSLARAFGVDRGRISRIVNRKLWARVD